MSSDRHLWYEASQHCDLSILSFVPFSSSRSLVVRAVQTTKTVAPVCGQQQQHQGQLVASLIGHLLLLLVFTSNNVCRLIYDRHFGTAIAAVQSPYPLSSLKHVRAGESTTFLSPSCRLRLQLFCRFCLGRQRLCNLSWSLVSFFVIFLVLGYYFELCPSPNLTHRMRQALEESEYESMCRFVVVITNGQFMAD